MLIDPESGRVLRIISLQYNPDSLTRTLQGHVIGDRLGQTWTDHDFENCTIEMDRYRDDLASRTN